MPRSIESGRQNIPPRIATVATSNSTTAMAWAIRAVFTSVNNNRAMARIHGGLRPGGHLLASFGCSDVPGWDGEWLGVQMYFSSFPSAENSRLVESAGL